MRPMAVAVIGTGEMGSAVAKRLLDGGCSAATFVACRSAASRGRVERLGLPVLETYPQLADHGELVLSIVPPAQARAAARAYRNAVGRAARPIIYADCNAIAPATAREIETIVAEAGVAFVDAGIIGGPPRPGDAGPIFFVCGSHAPSMLPLREAGLDVRSLGETVGAASALKLSYGGITKGLTALTALMQQHARDHGLGAQLDAVLQETRPELWRFIEPAVPAMYPKAYRWIAEMQEIARYTAPDDAGMRIFEGAARFYERVTSDLTPESANRTAPQRDEGRLV